MTKSQRIDKCILGYTTEILSGSIGVNKLVHNWAEFNSDGYCIYSSGPLKGNKHLTGQIPQTDLNNICWLTVLTPNITRTTGDNAICPRLLVNKISVNGTKTYKIDLTGKAINTIIGVWLSEEGTDNIAGPEASAPRFAIVNKTINVYNPATYTRDISVLIIAI